MKKSIKTAVWLRVIVIFVALVLSAVFTITGLLNIRSSSLSSKTANEIHVIAVGGKSTSELDRKPQLFDQLWNRIHRKYRLYQLFAW